jgi:hypothetical protein
MDLATKYLSMKSYQRNPLVSMEGSLDTIFWRICMSMTSSTLFVCEHIQTHHITFEFISSDWCLIRTALLLLFAFKWEEHHSSRTLLFACAGTLLACPPTWESVSKRWAKSWNRQLWGPSKPPLNYFTDNYYKLWGQTHTIPCASCRIVNPSSNMTKELGRFILCSICLFFAPR